MKKPNKKTLALTIVAFVLVLMSLISFTFSWIDDIKLVEFQNADVADGAPLKAGTDINATVKITKTENEINLGNMIKPSDITIQNYEYDEGYTAPHATYPRNEEEATEQQEFIDKNKGYFYESGGMHFSPCFGDGESFFFQRQGGQSGYREANKDDENVNYISFTVKVSSPDATTDFWFDSVPTIQGKNASGSNIDVSAKARYAIIVDGECHVYSNGGTALTCNSGLTGTTAVTGVRKTANYTYGDSTNKTAERGDNSNTLFTVQKGSTVNMTVKIWLEGGFDTNCTASNINLKLISSWAFNRTITIEDKTTGPQGKSWIGNNSAKLYLVLPEFLKEKDADVSHWWSQLRSQGAPIFELTSNNNSNSYTVTLPLAYNNEEMYIYRCNDQGWDDTGSDASARSPYQVHCWNWWGTRTPNTFIDETYTLYGCSLDESANYCFKFQLNSDQSFPLKTDLPNKGYGTWGGVDLINVYSEYSGTDYVPKYVTQNNEVKTQKLFVRDFSDYETSREVYIYEMCRLPSADSNNDGVIDNDDEITRDDPWQTYVPKSSSCIQFSAFNPSNSLFGVWGYNSWRSKDTDMVGDCPQQRPLKNEFFSANATVYHIAGNDSSSTNHTYGRGYWESGGQYVYLIKSGDMANVSPAYANLVDEHVSCHYLYKNSVMSNLRDTNNTKDIKFVRGNTSYFVCKSNDGVNYTPNQNNKNIYRDVNFNNNISQNNNWTVQSGNKRLYPGCFYHFSEQKWYGSLNDKGREASGGDSGGGGGSGTDAGGDSTDGYTGGSDGFKITLNGNTYNAVSKQTSNGTEYKVRIGGLSAGTHEIKVYKNSNQYKNGDSQGYKIFPTNSNMSLYITTGAADHNQEIGIQNYTSGNFIVTFHYDNWDSNRDTIMISSILKEGSS